METKCHKNKAVFTGLFNRLLLVLNTNVQRNGFLAKAQQFGFTYQFFQPEFSLGNKCSSLHRCYHVARVRMEAYCGTLECT